MVTAAWDFVCASLLSVLAYGSTFSRLWQGVAATVLGPAALTMGARSVAVGLGLHLVVALVCSAVLVIALATGRPPAIGFRWWVQLFAHVPFVTLPLVFTARRAFREPPAHSGAPPAEGANAE